MNFSIADINRIVGNGAIATLFGTFPVSVQNPPADHNERNVLFSAYTGYYDINMHRGKNPNCGIVETYLDGVLLHTWDGYDATGGIIDQITLTNIAISNGDHNLTFKINGKNAASSDYAAYHGWLSLNPR